jgi:single stranded DNA-binding protein
MKLKEGFMKDLNITVISGRLTADPLFKETKNGKGYCLFGLASNSFIKNPDGWQKIPTFVLVKCWDKLAATSFETLKKGTQVIIYGTLKYSVYNSADSTRKSLNYIQAHKIERVNFQPFVRKEDKVSEDVIQEDFQNGKKKKVKQIFVEEDNLVSVEN